MKRCTAVCSGRSRVAGVAIQPRRWVSYDKSTLTKEALLQQAESQLGHDVDGNPLRIDADKKTVTTAVGSLPISPIMDPAWMKAGRREKKRDPGNISGQFRKKLSNNPFGRTNKNAATGLANTSDSNGAHDSLTKVYQHRILPPEILPTRFRTRRASRKAGASLVGTGALCVRFCCSCIQIRTLFAHRPDKTSKEDPKRKRRSRDRI